MMEVRWFRVPPGRTRLPTKTAAHKLEIWAATSGEMPVGTVYFDGAWRAMCPHADDPLKARVFKTRTQAQSWCVQSFTEKEAVAAEAMLRTLDTDATQIAPARADHVHEAVRVNQTFKDVDPDAAFNAIQGTLQEDTE